MSSKSKIEWTDATWNPLTGCSPVSEGCRNCYAARLTGGRLAHLPQYAGLTEDRSGRPVFTGEIRTHEGRLEEPLHWRKPRRIFVNSMSDLFHPSVPYVFVDKVFAIMAATPQHTYQVLTKRPNRMRAYLADPQGAVRVWEAVKEAHYERFTSWPLPNVWVGASAENQAALDERLPYLLSTPGAVRFLSCEPLLGPLSLTSLGPLPDSLGLDWVIAGKENGPNARLMKPEWVHSIRGQCLEEGIPYFLKGGPLQGREWKEMP